MIISSLCLATAGLALTFILVWLLSISLKDVSIIDVLWGLAFIQLSWTYAILLESFHFNQLLPLALLTLWGLRISFYLGKRKWNSPEDKRYQSIRKRRDSNYPIKSLWIVFLPQFSLVLIINIPILINLSLSSNTTQPIQWFGLLLFAFGFIWESIADYQLSRFKKQTHDQGQICKVGLWSTSRYPNYFGESLIWFGIFFASMHSLWIGLGIISPILLTYLLLKVTGVPFKEPIMENKQGYEQYKESTPLFFPKLLKLRS